MHCRSGYCFSRNTRTGDHPHRDAYCLSHDLRLTRTFHPLIYVPPGCLAKGYALASCLQNPWVNLLCGSIVDPREVPCHKKGGGVPTLDSPEFPEPLFLRYSQVAQDRIARDTHTVPTQLSSPHAQSIRRSDTGSQQGCKSDHHRVG